jgi:Resolvase, N terminal domain
MAAAETGVPSGPARVEAVTVLANMTAAALTTGWGGGGERRPQDHGLASGRGAVVYLPSRRWCRSASTPESTMRQYGLVDEAVRLGWLRGDVQVIDTDLGVSGRWGVARQGFTELVGRACSGEVGAIFGIEISRLARSDTDVTRLLEFVGSPARC